MRRRAEVEHGTSNAGATGNNSEKSHSKDKKMRRTGKSTTEKEPISLEKQAKAENPVTTIEMKSIKK